MFGEIFITMPLRGCLIAIFKLTSPLDINLLSRSELALVTKYSLVFLVTNLNNKNNVFKQCCLLFYF